MKKILAVAMMMTCFLGTVSVANAGNFFKTIRPYFTVAPAYGWNLTLKSKYVSDGGVGKESYGYDVRMGIETISPLVVEGEYLDLPGFKGTTIGCDTPGYPYETNWLINLKFLMANLKLRFPIAVTKNIKISPFFVGGWGTCSMTGKIDMTLPLQHLNFSSNIDNSYVPTKIGGGIGIDSKHGRFFAEYSEISMKYNTYRGTEVVKKEYTNNVIVMGAGYKF
jgi:hypothetical protein